MSEADAHDEVHKEGREFVEFFRRDLGGTTRKILVPAAILVFVGAPGVCFGAAVNGSGIAHVVIGVSGVILLLSGLFLGFVGMARLVGEESYVAVARDGVAVHVGKSEFFFGWSEVRMIKSDERSTVIELTDARESVRVDGNFGGMNSRALAERLDDWRRKSDWKLTPSDRPKSS